MAEKVGEVYVELEARWEKFARGLKDALARTKLFGKKLDTSFTKFSGSLLRMAPGVSAVGIAVAAMYAKSIKMAIDATETNQKFAVTFSEVIDEANAMSAALAEGYGLARDEAQELLVSTGDLLTGFGFTQREALNVSNQVQELAADLASFNNVQGGTSAASAALTKALLGERESAKMLGIVIRGADVQQRVASMGMAQATGATLMQAQAQATLSIAVEQSQNAIGDFARSATSPANVIKRISARMRDIGVEIGTTVLPGLQDLGTAFLEASKDGGVLMEAAKGIGFILGKIGTALAVLINMFTALQRASQSRLAENALERVTSAASAAAQQQQALINQIRATGRISATSYGEARTQLERLTRAGGEQGRQAGVLLRRLEQYEAAVRSGTAESRELSHEYIRAADSSENASTELNRLALSLVGVNNETEQAIRTREAARAATDAGTTSTEKQRKALEKLRKEAARWYEQTQTAGQSSADRVEAQYKQQLAALKKYTDAQLITVRQAEQARTAIVAQYEQDRLQLRVQTMQQGLSVVSGIVGQIGSLLAMSAQNQVSALSKDQNKQTKILDAKYKADKKRIIAEIKDKDAQEAALAELDEKYAADKEKVDAEYEAKKRKIQYEAAKRQKAIAIVQAIINTAGAVTRALFDGGPFAGPALAALMGALGAAQIALIAQQPLPALAGGGFFSGPALIGESGREFAFPLDSAQGERAMGLLADKLMDTVVRKSADETTPSATVVDPGDDSNVINLTIQFADEIWQDKITDATKNRTIRIDRGALVG